MFIFTWCYERIMKKNFNVIIRIVFTFVIIYFMFNVIRIIYDVNELEKDSEEISEAVDSLEERVSKLKYRLDSPIDREYMERVAKENGYYSPDETVFYNNLGK